MENIKKIFPYIGEIKDYDNIKVVHVVFKKEVPFDVDEQHEIATEVEKHYKNYVFSGKISLICSNGGVTSYFLYYYNKEKPR